MEQIRAARKNAGFGLREAARALGTYPATVHEWETTDREPRRAYLTKMAMLYKVPVEALYPTVDDSETPVKTAI